MSIYFTNKKLLQVPWIISPTVCMHINSKFNVENLFVHSTTAVPICRCSFGACFHISVGQKEERIGYIFNNQFGVNCVYLKGFVKIFLRVEGIVMY